MTKISKPLVVCVINLKGGVGKSTIAALLARRAYSQKGKNVLAIDIDPQANLSQALNLYVPDPFARYAKRFYIMATGAIQYYPII